MISGWESLRQLKPVGTLSRFLRDGSRAHNQQFVWPLCATAIKQFQNHIHFTRLAGK
jgi:hypothetical protein